MMNLRILSNPSFYHLEGAYKAMQEILDLDGDLDIAAISFFPVNAAYPEESFVVLGK